jgi:hypothetical protein
MSETMKATDNSRKTVDQAAKAGSVSVDSTAKVTRDSIDETSKVAQNAADRAKETAQSVNETVAETAHAVTNMSSKMAEQSREAMLTGARAAADVSGRVGDISFGRSQHMMSSAAHAMDIYRDAAERSANRVQALMSSAMTLSRGLTSMQHAWFEMVDHSMETAAHKPQDLLRCKNMVELAEVQRDLYLDAINHAFESTSRLLEMAGRTAQDAVRPLRS